MRYARIYLGKRTSDVAHGSKNAEGDRTRYIDLAQPSEVLFPRMEDSSGALTVIHGQKEIPFAIARAYLISDIAPGASRGAHAHRKLRQVIMAAAGSFTLTVSSGTHSHEFFLTESSKGVYIPRLFWRELTNFSHDAVCLVFTDRPYEESDYIRSFSEYLDEANNG